MEKIFRALERTRSTFSPLPAKVVMTDFKNACHLNSERFLFGASPIDNSLKINLPTFATFLAAVAAAAALALGAALDRLGQRRRWESCNTTRQTTCTQILGYRAPRLSASWSSCLSLHPLQAQTLGLDRAHLKGKKKGGGGGGGGGRDERGMTKEAG